MAVTLLREITCQYKTHATQEPIMGPDAAFRCIRSMHGSDTREVFGILCVDTRNVPVAYAVVSIGSQNASIVDPKEVFGIALAARARSIILWHTHPSGNCTPSPEDFAVTKRLSEGGKLLDIPVIDHCILTADESYSMVDHGHILA